MLALSLCNIKISLMIWIFQVWQICKKPFHMALYNIFVSVGLFLIWQCTTCAWLRWIWRPRLCWTGSRGTAAGSRVRGRWAWSRTWLRPMAAQRWGSASRTPSTSSSGRSETPADDCCCSTASDPATGPAPTGPSDGPRPTRHRWSSAPPPGVRGQRSAPRSASPIWQPQRLRLRFGVCVFLRDAKGPRNPAPVSSHKHDPGAQTQS